MKVYLAIVASTLLASASALAIDPNYAKKLDRSGCTQISEAQGCDINKTKAENAKAGFGTAAPVAAASTYGACCSTCGTRSSAPRRGSSTA